ncbi:MFS transporter [Ruminococcus gauvreauii]|uniref:MFS transporter n=1 Tax=Ruminococcus gauvreauii TaxID=438033 RepID=A0ABY5VKD3_9FIRM|nr:MFS transporter [Ruminococcus gauvreauii]UWP61029.1 MFS transporter [Ruminococcus gauvreauii]
MKKNEKSQGYVPCETISKNLTGMERVPVKEKFSYGLGDMASCIVFTLTTALSTYFYTNVVGLSAAVIGTILLISKLFDGVSDIIIGILVDKTKSRHGKARAWLLWMTIPYGLTAVLMFLIPSNATELVQAVYVFITYNLAVTIVYTAINLPYGTLAAMMTRDQNERSSINIFRMVMANISNLIVSAATLPLIKLLGDTQKAWIKVTTIYAVAGMIMILLCFHNCHERVKIPAAAKGDKVTQKNAFKAMFSNKYWWMIGGMYLIWAVYMTLNGTMMTYFAEYELGNRDLMSMMNILEKGATVITVLTVATFIKKFGKRNLSLAGCVIMLIGAGMILVMPKNIPIVMIGVFLKGVGIGPFTACIYSMMADTIEYGNWRTGIRSEGLLYSAATLGYKIGSGLTSAMVGFVMDATGYDGLTAIQSQSAHVGIQFLFVGMPVIIWALMTGIIWLYRLDHEYPEIMRQLQRGEYSEKAY